MPRLNKGAEDGVTSLWCLCTFLKITSSHGSSVTLGYSTPRCSHLNRPHALPLNQPLPPVSAVSTISASTTLTALHSRPEPLYEGSRIRRCHPREDHFISTQEASLFSKHLWRVSTSSAHVVLLKFVSRWIVTEFQPGIHGTCGVIRASTVVHFHFHAVFGKNFAK